MYKLKALTYSAFNSTSTVNTNEENTVILFQHEKLNKVLNYYEKLLNKPDCPKYMELVYEASECLEHIIGKKTSTIFTHGFHISKLNDKQLSEMNSLYNRISMLTDMKTYAERENKTLNKLVDGQNKFIKTLLDNPELREYNHYKEIIEKYENELKEFRGAK